MFADAEEFVLTSNLMSRFRHERIPLSHGSN